MVEILQLKLNELSRPPVLTSATVELNQVLQASGKRERMSWYVLVISTTHQHHIVAHRIPSEFHDYFPSPFIMARKGENVFINFICIITCRPT
jgi:hypothetical protein